MFGFEDGILGSDDSRLGTLLAVCRVKTRGESQTKKDKNE